MKKSSSPEEKRELNRRIRAAGIPISDVVGVADATGLRIHQTSEGEIIDFPGGTGLIVALQIVVNAPSFTFCGFEVCLNGFGYAHFDLLEHCEVWPNYQFLGVPSRKYSSNQVVNSYIAKQKTQRRGYLIDGLLLASSLQPIPPEVLPYDVVRGSIAIVDQFEHRYRVDVALRAEKSIPKPGVNRQKRRGLFASPDSDNGAQEDD